MNTKIFMIEDDYTERKMGGNESRYSDIFMVINIYETLYVEGWE